MTTFVVPAEADVTALLELLYEGLSTQKADDGSVTPAHTAIFIDDDDKPVALIGCDLEFIAFTGTALSMIPAGAAEDMISDKELSQAVLDNFHEVMNISSKLLMTDSGAHLRLGKIFPSSDDAITSVIGELSQATKASFSIDIPRYGKGGIELYIT